MANPWYSRVFSALAGMKVKSKSHRDEFDLIQAAFDAVSDKFLGVLKLPASPTPADQVINFAAADRVGKLVSFDAAGNVTLVAAPPAAFGGTAASTVDLLSGASIASAATVNLDSATGNRVHITGTTAITAITLAKGPRTVIFDGALTLTHHATNLNLPGGANITTAAGDRAVFESDGTTVYCVSYIKASGLPVVLGAATQSQVEAAASSAVVLTPNNAKWHPGVAKAWLKCDQSGNIQASHNITSITDTGTGVVDVTIATDFSSANYSAVATGTSLGVTVHVESMAAGTLRMRGYTWTGTSYDATDSAGYMLACFGDQ